MTIEIKDDKELGAGMLYVKVNGEIVVDCINNKELSSMTIKDLMELYEAFQK